MRIAYITVQFPFGPKEAFLRPELAELLSQGHEVLVLALRPGNDFEQAHEAITANALPLNTWREWKAGIRSIAANRRFGPVMQETAFLATRGSLVARCKNLTVTPCAVAAARIVQTWGADHLHAYWASTPSTVAMIASMLTSIPWSFTAHRHDIVNNNLLSEKVNRASFVRFIAQDGLRLANLDEAQKCKALVLHLGVEIPRQTEVTSRTNTRFVVACPANLVEVKGHKYLIEALALLRDKGISAELRIIGDGPLRSALQAQMSQCGLNNQVRFLGCIPRDTLLSMYRKGDVSAVALASLDLGRGNHEGIPVALMEAMAHGIPVVATKTGAIPELVDASCGILVPPADTRMLAAGLEILITNPRVRMALAAEGHKRVESSFNCRLAARALVDRMAASQRKAFADVS